MKLKLMVIGHARHGKDTVCNLLRDIYGLKFVSSSYFVAEKAARPYLAKMGIIYPSLEACYADRVNHRPHWFNAIAAYNAGDAARLGRELFAEFDIYCGMRRFEEFQALRMERAFDVSFWVDRGLLCKSELSSSNIITQDMADYTIDNNGTLDYLRGNVISAYSTALRQFKDGSPRAELFI